MATLEMRGLAMFSQRTRNEIECTAVTEPLVGIAGERLRSNIRKLVQSGMRAHLLDLRSLRELDSSTLATLIRILRYARASDGSIGLIVDQEHFLKILSITALDRIFPIFRDEQSAREALEMADAIPA
jgi:anti-anti-sigma factor